MCADDTALFSECVEALQCLLDELYRHCNVWKMHVNAKKSKIVIFRNNDRMKK